MVKSLLTYMGVEPQRYQTAWISGAEGIKFQHAMEKLAADIKALGPNRKLRDAR